METYIFQEGHKGHDFRIFLLNDKGGNQEIKLQKLHITENKAVKILFVKYHAIRIYLTYRVFDLFHVV